MAKINISDLSPAGADFFGDSESFMNDLDTGELSDVNGGFSITVILTPTIIKEIIDDNNVVYEPVPQGITAGMGLKRLN